LGKYTGITHPKNVSTIFDITPFFAKLRQISPFASKVNLFLASLIHVDLKLMVSATPKLLKSVIAPLTIGKELC